MATAGRPNATHSFLMSATALGCCVIAAMAQSERYAATAAMTTGAGTTVRAAVAVTITTFASESDRGALVAAVKAGGTNAARAWLIKRPDAGTLQVGARKATIKFAYKTPVAGGGSLITVGTSDPIALVGAGLPGAPQPAGEYLGLLLFDLPAEGQGRGELAPAAKVRVDANGAIVTEDFNVADIVRLTEVVRK